MLADRRARRPRRGARDLCRRWEVRARWSGTVTAGGAGCASSTAGRRRAGRRPRGVAPRGRAAVRPAPSAPRPVGASARPGHAARARRRRQPTCSACSTDPPWVWSQYDHQLFLNTVAGPGRRRHRAAPQAPRHRRRHRAGAGPDHRRQPPVVRGRPAGRHGARRGRGGPQPGLRRGAAARARQLPELRQPGAPRGDVGALGGHRRDGRGLPRLRPARGGRERRASTTRARGRDIDPTPVVGVLGMVDDLERRPPGRRLEPGGRLLVLGPDARGQPGRVALGVAAGGEGRRARGARPARGRGPRRARAAARCRRPAAGRARRGRRRPGAGAGRDGGRLRGRRRADGTDGPPRAVRRVAGPRGRLRRAAARRGRPGAGARPPASWRSRSVRRAAIACASDHWSTWPWPRWWARGGAGCHRPSAPPSPTEAAPARRQAGLRPRSRRPGAGSAASAWPSRRPAPS